MIEFFYPGMYESISYVPVFQYSAFLDNTDFDCIATQGFHYFICMDKQEFPESIVPVLR